MTMRQKKNAPKMCQPLYKEINLLNAKMHSWDILKRNFTWAIIWAYLMLRKQVHVSIWSILQTLGPFTYEKLTEKDEFQSSGEFAHKNSNYASSLVGSWVSSSGTKNRLFRAMCGSKRGLDASELWPQAWNSLPQCQRSLCWRVRQSHV